MGGGISGAATAAIPGYGLGPALARSTVSGIVGGGQHAASEALHGRDPTIEGALGSAAVTFGGSLVGDVVGQLRGGVPARALIGVEPLPYRFRAPPSSVDVLSYMAADPEVRRVLLIEHTVIAWRQGFRETLLNIPQ